MMYGTEAFEIYICIFFCTHRIPPKKLPKFMPTIIDSEIPPPFPHFHNSKVLVENLIKSRMCGTHLFQGFLACICKTAGRILGHGQFHRVWLLQRSRDSGLKGGKSEGISLTPRFVSKCHRKHAGSSLLSHIFLGVLDGIRGVDPLR